MRTFTKTLTVFILLFAFAAFWGCDSLKEAINESTKKTERMELDLADKAPLYAIEYNGYSLQALCANKLTTIDELVGATDYADLWASAKDNLNEIDFVSFSYEIRENISTGGYLYLYLVNVLPNPLVSADQLKQFGVDIDETAWIVVDPSALDNADRVAFINIPAGQNVTDWVDGSFMNDGSKRLEEQFLDFESEFAFCMALDMDVHAPTSTKPDLKISLKAIIDLTFTALK